LRSCGARLVAVVASSLLLFAHFTAAGSPDGGKKEDKARCVERFGPIVAKSGYTNTEHFCDIATNHSYEMFVECYALFSKQNATLYQKADEGRADAAYGCTNFVILQKPQTFVDCRTWFKGAQKEVTKPEELQLYCSSSEILMKNFDAFKACFQKLAATKLSWKFAYYECQKEKTQKNPELLLQRFADTTKCRATFATELAYGPRIDEKDQSYYCMQVTDIGKPFWSCYDTMTASYRDSKLDAATIAHNKYFYFTNCLSERVRDEPKQFKACYETLAVGDAISICQNKIVRKNPSKFAACVKKLASGYSAAEAMKTCTIPLVLKDPAGFLMRNPGKTRNAAVPVESPKTGSESRTGVGVKK
jgi:hypothetical protein